MNKGRVFLQFSGTDGVSRAVGFGVGGRWIWGFRVEVALRVAVAALPFTCSRLEFVYRASSPLSTRPILIFEQRKHLNSKMLPVSKTATGEVQPRTVHPPHVGLASVKNAISNPTPRDMALSSETKGLCVGVNKNQGFGVWAPFSLGSSVYSVGVLQARQSLQKRESRGPSLLAQSLRVETARVQGLGFRFKYIEQRAQSLYPGL